MADFTNQPELIEEQGFPVLRTGQPLDVSVVEDTIDRICRERELSILGPFPDSLL